MTYGPRPDTDDVLYNTVGLGSRHDWTAGLPGYASVSTSGGSSASTGNGYSLSLGGSSGDTLAVKYGSRFDDTAPQSVGYRFVARVEPSQGTPFTDDFRIGLFRGFSGNPGDGVWLDYEQEQFATISGGSVNKSTALTQSLGTQETHILEVLIPFGGGSAEFQLWAASFSQKTTLGSLPSRDLAPAIQGNSNGSGDSINLKRTFWRTFMESL